MIKYSSNLHDQNDDVVAWPLAQIIDARRRFENWQQVAKIREKIAALRKSQRCSKRCPGWAVMEGNMGWSIQACIDCSVNARPSWDDDDVALLPEAQLELLRRVRNELKGEIPSTQFG